MSSYNHLCDSDHRNEGWTFSGSGVDQCWKAWSNDDDTKYCKCPSYKGRACVRFPIDISSGNIPDGAVITSVTVFLRCAKTVGSGTRSVTINILSSDNTSKYTSRTIYPTTAITTYEVGTYTKDPLGRAWSKHTLNKLMAQVFSYCRIADGVRCYKFYAQVNYHVRPTVTVDAPTGTVSSPSPTVSWTYAQADGDAQLKGEYKIFRSTQQAASSFDPDTSTAVYSGHVTGDLVSFILPTTLTPDAYYTYVRVTSSFGAKSLWAGRAFTVQGAAPGVPGGGYGGVGTGGGGGFVSVVADSTTSSAYLTLRDGSNLLSVQQADFETTTDSLGYTSSNATIAQDTTTFYSSGGASMKMTASTAANMSATSAHTEVAEGTPITARAQVRAAATGRDITLGIRYYNDAFSFMSTDTVTVADSTSTWTELVVTGVTVPAGASFARVQILVASPASSEVHNVDGVGLMYGTGSVWSHGGHMSRNLLSSAASDADDPITVEPWAAKSSASTYTRATASGTGSEGSKQFKMTYVGISPSITLVNTGTAFTDTSSGTGFTLNKPSSVVTGDVLVAYVASDTGGVPTPPAGWTLVNSVLNAGSSGLAVMTRDALTADPSTWAGNFASTATRKRAVVVAYRGAAPATEQFIAENVAASTGGSLTPTTATVNNTDSNAWRLSAFAVRDGVASGAMIANIAAPSVSANIAYVGKGTVWSTSSNNTAYTINRPSGVVSGDLLIASLTLSGNVATVTAPTGWTLVRSTVKVIGNGDEHSGSVTLAVLKRTAGGSEPTSWAGTHTATGQPKLTQCVAYRNAADASLQFIAENGSATLTSASVTNTDSRAWRVSAFATTSPYGGTTTSTEVTERADGSTAITSFPDVSGALYDSNGQVGTGAHSRTGNFTGTSTGGGGWGGSTPSSEYAACSWIGLIKPLASPPSPGANETERQDATAGSSTPWLTLAAYDSNAVAATGLTSVTGQFTPGSGTTVDSSACWIGFLKPAAPTVAGEVGATLADYVDISNVDQAVVDRSEGKMTLQAGFLGSTDGTPFLRMYFYKGNELLSTQLAEGTSFNTSVWAKSAATFTVPDGTTRIKCGVSATDRAVSDIVYFDRVSVAFGTAEVWRRGTGRTTHPIFNVPLIEYTEDLGDGYGDWQTLPGLSNALLRYDQLTGLTTFVDQTLVPLSGRKYRAKTVSYGLAGDMFVSAYGPESDEVTLTAAEWWLKDLEEPLNSMQLKVKADPLGVETSNTGVVFQPLGEDFPVVLTEGYKGDTIAVTVIVDRVQYARLRNLLALGRTLFLQSNMDNAWWVRPVGGLSAETQLTGKRGTDPLRFVKATFVQVAPEL